MQSKTESIVFIFVESIRSNSKCGISFTRVDPSKQIWTCQKENCHN